MQVNLRCCWNRDFSRLYNCTFCISDFFNLTVTSFCVVACFFFFKVLRSIFLFRCSGGLIAPLNPARCRHCKLAWGEEARRTTACRGRAAELFPASLLYLDKGLFAQFYHCVGTDHVNIKLHVHMDRRAYAQSWLSVQLRRQSHVSEHLQKRKPELLNSPGGDGVCSYIQYHLAQEQFYLQVTI